MMTPDQKVEMLDALAEHLIEKGLAEESAGFGHADGEQVADGVLAWLFQHYDVEERS